MLMNNIATWLDTVCAPFDNAILEFWHSVAQAAGTVLTPLMELVSLTGDKGIVLLLFGLILMLFSKTRKTGVCVFFAICCGAIITNLALKPLIARVRPYEASDMIRGFWEFVGASRESDLSFPSGHATATTAAMVGLVLARGKKYLWICIPYVSIMCISRNYLMVHYPTDVIAGVIAGSIGAVVAYCIIRPLYKKVENAPERKFNNFLLNSSITNLFRPKVS
jgi:undecaprenyl-diphosphatase